MRCGQAESAAVPEEAARVSQDDDEARGGRKRLRASAFIDDIAEVDDDEDEDDLEASPRPALQAAPRAGARAMRPAWLAGPRCRALAVAPTPQRCPHSTGPCMLCRRTVWTT